MHPKHIKAKAAAVFTTTVLLVAGMAAPSFASSTDPLNGAGSGLFTTLTSYLTTILVPAVIGLALVGIAVTLLMKWGKKGAKSG